MVEWLGHELWILRPWIGSQSSHIEFFFFLKFNTEIVSLKMEQWLKRLTPSWKFADQKFQETNFQEISYKFQEGLHPVRHSKYTSVYGSCTNSGTMYSGIIAQTRPNGTKGDKRAIFSHVSFFFLIHTHGCRVSVVIQQFLILESSSLLSVTTNKSA